MKKENFMEQILLREDSRRDSREACEALSELYVGKKPVSARAYALKARRLGSVEAKHIGKRTDEVPAADPSGSFLLGRELCLLERYEEAIVYLEAAGYANDSGIAASAALFLADLLSRLGNTYREKASFWYRRAKELGNPDILPCLCSSDKRSAAPTFGQAFGF